MAQLGIVAAVKKHAGGGCVLSVAPSRPIDARRGDSIAVNGVCLTVADAGDSLAFEVVPETLARTNLGGLGNGDMVNIETSLRAGEQIGGHLVYGHIDATTIVLGVHREGQGARLRCVTPRELALLIVEKGSVALDGVSLTVATIGEGEFEVALIPETLERTTLGRIEAGSVLNLEADPIARYVAHQLRGVEKQ